ncbi:MAG: protein kinase [Chloroflexales bacterium]|nr:protein kinase [Chloroflexales bacterium]
MTELNLIGTTLGRFEILKELGRGGMAVVYQARQTDLDRIVALKVLPPALTHDASYVARFHQEARSAARLEHPHIMPIYEVGEAGGLHYIAMKYIAGRTVKDLVQDMGSLPVQQAAIILAQVGDALDYAHRQGVIHRDIKPSNMMVTEESWVYLTDFGLARGTGGGAGLTMAGTVMGTPEYMSPEQAQGLPNVGPATDIYALGVVLYELLTGAFPFKADTPMGMLAARLLQAPTPPRDIRDDLPTAVEDVVMRALARKPEARFASAATMVDALRVAAGIGSADPTRPATPIAGMPALGATLVAAPQPPAFVVPTPPSNPPYVRQAAPPQVTVPASALPPLPGAQMPQGAAGVAAGPPAATAPRRGPSNLTVILAALGVAVLACVGLFAALAIRGDPGPRPVSTPAVSDDVRALVDQADQALGDEKGLAVAISRYRKALELAPRDQLVLARLALATNASGDWPAAEEYANQLIDAPSSSDSQIALGYALLADALASQGDMTAALAEIPKAIKSDKTLALGHAINSNLLASRALAISDTAEMDGAMESLDRAVDSLDDEEPLVQALTRHALGYTFGKEYQLSGDDASLRQSKEQYQAAIDMVPGAGLFRANLASLLSLDEDYDGARDGFAEALDAGYAPAQADIGWMYYDEGETEQAEQAFDQAIALAPASPEGYYGKGRLRYDEEDYDGAIDLLAQAVERNPRGPALQGWLGEAYFWKGFYSDDQAAADEAFAQATAAYNAAIERDDRYAFAVSGLAWTLQHQEQYEQSVAMFERAIKLEPDRAANYDGKGWSLFNQGSNEEAEGAFRAALEQDDSYADAHYHLGRVLEEQGHAEEARAEYQRTLDLDESYSAAQERLDNLGE